MTVAVANLQRTPLCFEGIIDFDKLNYQPLMLLPLY
jgi:hypothetical protein